MDTPKEFVRLVDIMKRLRKDCPWDSEQTPESLRQYIIEEAYEVVDAIEGGSVEDLREELGDLLLQVVFQSEIADEAGRFDIEDVLRGINDKLVRRHPHVFAKVDVSGSDEVVQNWEAIKRTEKTDAARLDGVPRALPALLRAARVIEKCRRTGIDFAPEAKAEKEVREGVDALFAAPDGADERAVGRVLFLLAGWVRSRQINPEDALRGFEDAVIAGLHGVERRLAEGGRRLEDLGEEEARALAVEILKI